jgi:hypothetical protein
MGAYDSGKFHAASIDDAKMVVCPCTKCDAPIPFNLALMECGCCFGDYPLDDMV